MNKALLTELVGCWHSWGPGTGRKPGMLASEGWGRVGPLPAYLHWLLLRDAG